MRRTIKLPENRLLPERFAERLRAFIDKQDLWGKRLPSQRDLAGQMKVGLVTVNKGIGLLKKRGVLECVPKRGTFVMANPAPVVSRGMNPRMIFICWQKDVDPRLQGYSGALIAPLLELSAELRMDSVFTRLEELRSEQAFIERYEPSTDDMLVFVSVYTNIDKIMRVAKNSGARAVWLDHFVEGTGITGVLDDGQSGMKAVGLHLAGLGHRRVALLAETRQEMNPWKRAGLEEGLAEAGLKLDGSMVLNALPRQHLVDEFVRHQLERPDAPTAFAAVDDNRALMAIRTLEELGLKPGQNVSVAGYGDSAAHEGLYGHLTSVEVDARKIGETARDCLLGKHPERLGQAILVGTRLIVRESTGKEGL